MPRLEAGGTVTGWTTLERILDGGGLVEPSAGELDSDRESSDIRTSCPVFGHCWA